MTHHLPARRRIAVVTTLAVATTLVACDPDDDPPSSDRSEATTPAATTPLSDPDAATTTAPAATPTTAPATTAPATTAATSSASTTAADAGAEAGVEAWSIDAVGPGTFATTLMEPGFTLTYGEGWVPFMPESRNQLNVEIPESDELGCAPCGLLGVSAAEVDAAEDVAAQAVEDGLELAEPVEVDVGGITGQRYEVTGGAGIVFDSEFSSFGIDSADGPARFTVLEAGGRVIVIHELASPDAVDEVWALSGEVVDSIEWADG